MLIAMKERRELRQGQHGKPKEKIDADDFHFSKTTSLADLQITPDESSNAQALASVPEAKLEEIIDQQTDNGKLSTQAVIREVRKVAKPKGIIKPNRAYVKRPGKKLTIFWTKMKNALNELSLEDLEKLAQANEPWSSPVL
jgi:hypothetical protein